MALERPEPGWVWLHVPRKEAVDVVVCSDIHTWWAHFTRLPGQRVARAVRCAQADGESCEWCESQIGRRARYVFAVRVADQVRLVELGRVQFPQLQVFYSAGLSRWLGTRLRLSREWDAANARIEVLYQGRENLSDECVVDPGDYVAGLGQAERRMFRPNTSGQPAPPSKGSAGATRNAWSDRSK